MPSTSLTSTNNFTVDIERLPIISALIQSINLPSITINETTLSSATQDYTIPSNKLEYGKLDISFNLDADWNAYEEIYGWMNSFKDNKAPLDEVCDGTILFLSNQKNPIGRAIFYDLYPISVSDAASTIQDHQPMNLSVTLAFTSFKFNKINNL